MADTSKRFYGPALLTGAAADLFTVAALKIAQITSIHVFNNDVLPVNLTLSIGVDAAGTRLFDAFPISGKGIVNWTGMVVLAAAEKMQGLGSSASKLNITISGVESDA